MAITKWMSWEGGVDLVAVTQMGLSMPNVIMHVARLVHTPLGSAASGMVLYQPDPAGPPTAMGFISHNTKVGGYFGPNIFAGTPFEPAPVLEAKIEVITNLPNAVSSRIEVGGFLFEIDMTDLSPLELINRAPAAMPPFHQQGLEAKVGKVNFKVNGNEIKIIVPPVGITGGPAAVWAPCGIYAR
jgi:hypothetical protein